MLPRRFALVASLPLYVTACYDRPDPQTTADGTTTETGGAATDTGTSPPPTTTVDPDAGSSGSPATDDVDPDTTMGTSDPSSTGPDDDGDTTRGVTSPEIEVSIDGVALASGETFEIPDTVAVDAAGAPVSVTVQNVGTADLLVGGVSVAGGDGSHFVIDQDELEASIPAGDSSTFSVAFAPINGGHKSLTIDIANDDGDESPFQIALRGHTTENTYRLIGTVGSPSPRFNAPLVDLQDGRLLMFGGRDATGVHLADTWMFEVETSTWTQLAPPASPSARNAHGMALVGDGVVLFGGNAAMGGGGLGDTWRFDIATEAWSQLLPPVSPSPRFQHELVTIGDGQAMLFGGRSATAGSETADTWIFDVATETWADPAPAGSPPAVASYAMAFDGDDTVTRFGGFIATTPIAETWHYTLSTNTWAAATPTGSPGARAVLSGEYLEAGAMIVFSGKLGDCCIDPAGGTFAYDPAANSWTDITPPGEPTPRFNYAMTAVAGQNKAIVFGGLLQNTGVGTAQGETWEYVGPRP